MFICNEVASGRYGSASEVVRDALRTLEERKTQLDVLRDHLSEGARQAKAGNFVTNYSIEKLLSDLDSEQLLRSVLCPRLLLN